MEQERLMLQLAAQGRIFLLGGGGREEPPQPAPLAAPIAVQVDAGSKGRKKSYDRRKRMALAGQQSMMGGGGMASGGAVSGQSLMGT